MVMRSLLCMGFTLAIFAGSTWTTAEDVTLIVGDKASGRTIQYVAVSNMTELVDRKTQEKYIRDIGCNASKYWEIWDKIRHVLRHRRFLYGPNTKAIAVRQVSEELENIDWGLELFGSDKLMKKMTDQLSLLKKHDVEPLMDLVAKYRLTDELDKQILWRWSFLYPIWTNKVKGYDISLWELGNECDRRMSKINSEVGSAGLKEAERFLGTKIRVAAVGHHDWRKVSLADVIDQMLAGEAGKRLDAISFHSYPYNRKMKFPGNVGAPSFADWMKQYDAIQQKYRAKPLPWWDTEFGWWPTDRTSINPWGEVKGVGVPLTMEQSNHLSAIEYATRIIWQSRLGFEYTCVWKLFSPEDKYVGTMMPPTFGGMIKVKKGTGEVRVTKPYYAVRMVARALAGGKEDLPVTGAPENLGLMVSATRDKEKTYVILVNRHSKKSFDVNIALPERILNQSFSVHEVNSEKNDQQVQSGKVSKDLKINIAPLSIKQLIVSNK